MPSAGSCFIAAHTSLPLERLFLDAGIRAPMRVTPFLACIRWPLMKEVAAALEVIQAGTRRKPVSQTPGSTRLRGPGSRNSYNSDASLWSCIRSRRAACFTVWRRCFWLPVRQNLVWQRRNSNRQRLTLSASSKPRKTAWLAQPPKPLPAHRPPPSLCPSSSAILQ